METYGSDNLHHQSTLGNYRCTQCRNQQQGNICPHSNKERAHMHWQLQQDVRMMREIQKRFYWFQNEKRRRKQESKLWKAVELRCAVTPTICRDSYNAPWQLQCAMTATMHPDSCAKNSPFKTAWIKCQCHVDVLAHCSLATHTINNRDAVLLLAAKVN